MKKLKSYIQSAWYNIRHNKAYALFCVFGTALTFVFVTIILQMCLMLTSDRPPFVHTGRMFVITDEIYDADGKYLGGIEPQSLNTFMETVKGHEQYYITNSESINMLINGLIRFGIVEFTNSAFWTINQFDFIEGRPYTPQEEKNRVAQAVITESFAKKHYRNGSAVGQELEFQGNTYKIVGVIANYSDLLAAGGGGGAGVWVSSVFNKFVPSYGYCYHITVLFEKGMSQVEMKRSLSEALQFYYKNRNIDAKFDPDDFRSKKEASIKQFGGDALAYGIGLILFFLLLVPAVNILMLSHANVDNRTSEIAIRRAIGASRRTAFWQMMMENFILVLAGTLLGVLFTYPATELLGSFILGGTAGDVHIISKIDPVVVVCGVFPLCLLFTLLSGGPPAYVIAKKNIVELLKGGSKW